ncbi:MAG TPA: alpha-glucosidase C-terminal domain-containing protein [Cellvibrionaceae bacterium]
MSDEELQLMLSTLQSFGGKISTRTDNEGNEKPYEANISLFDALKGTYHGSDQWQVERLISSQAIMLAVEGIPAFYLHTLFATPNDQDKLLATNHNRAINRRNWNLSDVYERINQPDGPGQRVFNELTRLIKLRAKQPAFHPNATQFTLHIRPEIFAFWRQSMDRRQSLFCIYNLSDQPQELSLADINLISTESWVDIISGTAIDDLYGKIILAPYQNLWLTNLRT